MKLKHCTGCGEGVTAFCRGSAADCASNLPKLPDPPDVLILNTSRVLESAPVPVKVWPFPTMTLTEAAQYDAFKAGWKAAAEWANRPDLESDIGSPAYTKEFDKFYRKG